uniref:Uncharacterized protein n=1 Tax=Rhizophora mucronata TaxID=61149 RepID=A0A2P2QBF2_RHIMU
MNVHKQHFSIEKYKLGKMVRNGSDNRQLPPTLALLSSNSNFTFLFCLLFPSKYTKNGTVF